MMNIQHLRYFLALGEELHFGRAASRLHLSQPALTRAIQQLEYSLGIALLTRNKRNVALTSVGELFLTDCRSAVAAIDMMTDRARRAAVGEIGRVRIGYTDIAVAGVLPNVVRSFRAACPDVHFSANHGCTQQQIDDLENDRLDVGFFTGPWTRSGYETWTVQRDAFVAVLPASHPLATRSVLTLDDFAKEPFVLGDPRSWSHYNAHLYEACRAAKFQPAVVQYASNNEGILGIVACGIGVSILAESIRTRAYEGIVMRSITGDLPTVPTIAAWRSSSRSPITDRLVTHVKAIYSKPADVGLVV